MKIKKKSQTSTFITIGLLIASVIVLSFLVDTKSSKSLSSPLESYKNSYDRPTLIEANRINYRALINSEEGLLYASQELSIYLVTNVGVPKIVYLYKGDIKGRKETDNFFLHAYLKGTTQLRSTLEYINLDFVQKPQHFTVDGVQYYSFIRELKSDDYTHPYVIPDSILHINTGRFRPKQGRSLDLKRIVIPKNIPSFQTSLPTVTIKVKQKNFEKIKEKRKDALKKGVHISSDDDLVPGTITIGNQEATKIDFRLKGDWTDHLQHDKKWSYRVITKGDKTVRGMRKFSIQNPKARGLLWEWLFNKVIKDQGLIGLRYDFVNLNLEVTKNDQTEVIETGLMAWEEAFDKILIENNAKREGVILAFDESLYWSDQEREKHLKLTHKTYSETLRDVANAPIKVFNQGKIIADPGLNKQLVIAREMLEGLRQGSYKLSEVFDVDKLTTFVALTNLFGGSHGLVWHNIRIYYNPITNKFEPISFDSNSGTKIDRIHHYPFYNNDDKVYEDALNKKLKWVSDSDFINSFISTYRDELNALQLTFLPEYPLAINLSKLEYNSNYIKKQINPGTLITAHLDTYNTQSLQLTINNLTNYDVTINALQHEDRKTLSAHNFKPTTVPVGSSKKITFPLNEYFNNVFVSKKNKKGAFQLAKDYKKLRVAHFISGIEIPRLSEIYPLPKNPDYKKSMDLYKKSSVPNFMDYTFIEERLDTLLLKEGKHKLAKNLVIPDGFIVVAEKGLELDMIQGASIRSRSPLHTKGTKDKPIRFFSSDGSGGGLFITNAVSKSHISYTTFDNLSNPQSRIWSVSGAVNFHESDVTINHTTFKNNRCEDALNIIRSDFTMQDSSFIGTQSDSFDGDFVTGTIQNCTFINSGNDSIDISGSDLLIQDITIRNPLDKGISAGENSAITGDRISITGGEIGVVSKDLSTIALNEVSIKGTRLGLSAFQKKSEYGVASIAINSLNLQDIEVEHLIEVRSSLTIDRVAVETVSNNVINQMYGKEYGKSSK